MLFIPNKKNPGHDLGIKCYTIKHDKNYKNKQYTFAQQQSLKTQLQECKPLVLVCRRLSCSKIYDKTGKKQVFIRFDTDLIIFKL